MATIGTAYVSQFGSKVLHNGITHRSLETVSKLQEAVNTIIELPNGLIFDTYGSGAAPTKPKRFKATVLLQYASSQLAEGEFQSIIDLIGTRETVTAVNADTSTSTCQARLHSVAEVTPDKNQLNGIIKVQLTFIPLEVWS